MSVTQIFSGDTKDLEAAYRKLVAEDIKLRAELQKTASESKRGAHEAASAFDKIGESIGDQVRDLGHMVTGLLTVEKGVEFVTEAFGEWREEMKKLAAEHKQFADDLTKTVGATGEVRDAVKVEELANRQKYAAPAETLSAFKEVRGAAPGMDEKRQLELTEAAAKTAPLTDAGQMGRLVGNLGQMLPESSGEELTGMSLKAQHLAGNEADQLTSNNFLKSMKILQKGGMEPENALGLGVSTLRENISPKLLETLATGIETAPEMVQQKKQKPRRRGEAAEPPEPLTAAEQAQNKLAATTSIKERLDLAFRDKDVREHLLGQKGADELDLVASKNTFGAEIRGAGNYSQEQLALAASDGGTVGQSMKARASAQRAVQEDAKAKREALDAATKSQDLDTTGKALGLGIGSRATIAAGVSAAGFADDVVHGTVGKSLMLDKIPGVSWATRAYKDKMTAPAMEDLDLPAPPARDLGERIAPPEPSFREGIREKLHGFGNLIHNYGDKIRAEAREPGEKQVDKGDATRELVNLTRETNSLLRRGGQNTSVNAHSE